MSDHSSMYSESSSTLERLRSTRAKPTDTHKVHYNAQSDYDFILEATEPIDTSLALPHYRARNQPIDHRLAMFISTESSPIKVKIRRSVPRCRFFLDVRTAASNVTIWLPSDFRGHIRCSGRPSFSAGFVNRMMANVHVNEAMSIDDNWDGDEVWVDTRGVVMFRMWDVCTNAPESPHIETFKRLFSSTSRKSPENSINWDFLLDD